MNQQHFCRRCGHWHGPSLDNSVCDRFKALEKSEDEEPIKWSQVLAPKASPLLSDGIRERLRLFVIRLIDGLQKLETWLRHDKKAARKRTRER